MIGDTFNKVDETVVEMNRSLRPSISRHGDSNLIALLLPQCRTSLD